MAGLPLPPVPYTKQFAQIVSDFAAAAQAQSNTPLDFNVGSVFLALAEAVAGNADWLQKLYLFALLVERLQTSQGAWVDTWTADFMPPVPGTDSPRLPASPAAGIVVFSRSTPQNQAIIPVGTLVATFDGVQVYQINADLTNPAYNATIIPGGGFVLPAGQTSINITATALTPGIGGNVLANSITRIQSSVVGVDTVNNPAPFIDGLDQESDDALKARFKLYIASLREGTPGAIDYAVKSLQQGLQDVIHEGVDPDGKTDYGNFTLYVDDGSGNPPESTVQNASTAVNAVRAAGIRYSCIGASIIDADVVMTITTAAGYDHPTVVAAVANAVGAYINALGLEATLHYTEIAHVAYNASPGVTNVTNLTLNNGVSDLIPGMGQTIKSTGVTVS